MRRSLWVILALLMLAVIAVQAQGPEPTPFPLYALPDSRLARVFTSSTLALSSDGRELVAANMLNNSISFINVMFPNAAELIQEVPVGSDPRDVALTPDNRLALVTLA